MTNVICVFNILLTGFLIISDITEAVKIANSTQSPLNPKKRPMDLQNHFVPGGELFPESFFSIAARYGSM